MKKIKLSDGYNGEDRRLFALVDDADFEEINKFSWYPLFSKNDPAIRAIRSVKDKVTKKKSAIYMHRQILGAIDDKNHVVDHINGNCLDNRRSNLRLCLHKENTRNARKRLYKSGKKTSSRYKGVCLATYYKKPAWFANIRSEGKQYYLGTFPSERLAAKAYDKKAQELHGEFARLNFPRRTLLNNLKKLLK
jgi:hypothetical protein